MAGLGQVLGRELDCLGKLYGYSTVVIWSGHIGSYEGHALLLGKDLHKDLVNRGTLG